MTGRDQERATSRATVETPAGERSSFRTLLLGACLVVFVVLVLAGYDGSRDLARLKARETQLESRLAETQAGIEDLRDRIERLKSDPYTLERVAREELGLSRSGEVVVILPPSPQPRLQTEEPAPRTPTPVTP